VDPGTLARLEERLGCAITTARSIGGQHGVAHFLLERSDGRTVFAKLSSSGAGFAAEAAGLQWLGEAGAAVPAVLGWDEDFLVLDWIEGGAPDRATAFRFGKELAAVHASGADGFGAPWAGVIAGLPLPNEPAAPGQNWAQWYAEARVLPYVRMARDNGVLSADDVRLLEAAAAYADEVAGPPESPARIHGDLWSGNVLWSAGRGWLIDPAAHGGHRETDLAMLALFGAPHLEAILAGYQERAPLAAGWPGRVPLHQLHPLLVHVCLFGGSYVSPALGAARAVLAG
jgi:fructosamine-3-kinase